MALSYGAQGTSSSGTTSCTPTYPTGISASTSELFAIVTGRSSTGAEVTGPTGWTDQGQLEDGPAVAYGVDVGPRRVALFRKDTVTGSETGTVQFSFGSGNASSTISATIFRVVKTTNYTVTAQFASGADTSSGTAYSATSSTSLDFNTGDFLLAGTAQNIDTGTGSSRAFTATGVTFASLALLVDAAVTNGNDHRRILQSAQVSSADTATTVTASYTISAAGGGPTAFLLLTEAATDVSVTLVGSGGTFGAGTVSVPRSSGQAMGISQGSVSAVANTLALSGQAITSAQGTTTANADGTLTLVGQASTVSAGSPAVVTSKAATGSEATSAAGTTAPNLIPTNINFPTLALSTGTVTAQGETNVTVHLSGVEADFAIGLVDSGGQATTGSAATFAAGSVSPAVSKALSGSEAASSIGTVTPEQLADDTYIASAGGSAAGAFSLALSGSASTLGQGTMTVTGDAVFALTGEAITSAAGTLTPVPQVALTGAQIASAQYFVGAPGGATLTGSAVSVVAGNVFTTNDRTFSLTGEGMTALDGSTFASPLAFVTGQALVGSTQQIGLRDIQLSGQASTVEAGTITAGPANRSGFVMYIPFRAVSGIFTDGGDVSDALNATTNKNWLPPPNEPLVDEKGRMRASWFKFFEYIANKKLGGINAPSLPDIEAAVNASQEAVTSNTATVSEVASVVLQNAAVLQAAVEVAQNNSLSGAGSIPAPRISTK